VDGEVYGTNGVAAGGGGAVALGGTLPMTGLDVIWFVLAAATLVTVGVALMRTSAMLRGKKRKA
jgi:purine-cytosine permease-like protein